MTFLDGKAEAIEAMNSIYRGSFNPEKSCWETFILTGNDRTDYCLRLSNPEIVSNGKEKKIYFFAYNIAENDPDGYTYSHADPGLATFASLTLSSDGTWKTSEIMKDAAFGSNGDCGCSDAKLVALGDSARGWIFAHGGVWQGVVVTNYAVIAPFDGKYLDAGGMPQVEEDNQGVEYTLRIQKESARNALYPLVLSSSSLKNSREEKRFRFDEKNLRYIQE